ncbi:Aste57867_14896 [Aphanomyces stellatus]|uniref:Aste57867_14896 protein n=1 Tax=Aphanomyces stellatus TaxID=120398 RepID=A0A485L2Q0_9STRA|nr:hypothetical protein As57867_014840 [Aphanomyces stellatus]VFT91712.1 Aste57867_14896 [Aphanomyces stellatus]
MMRRLALAAAAAGVAAAASPCPYVGYSAEATILVADSTTCGPLNTLCLVDFACRKVQYINGTRGHVLGPLSAIGDLRAYDQTTSLTITCTTTDRIRTTDLALPLGLQSLTITSCGLQPDSFDHVEWAQLASLSLDTNGLQLLPTNLPRMASSLSVTNNLVRSLDGFVASDALRQLDLRNNKLQTLTRLDWTNQAEITLDGNTALNAITNVTMTSARLTRFSLRRCPVSSFIVEKATLDALANLPPVGSTQATTGRGFEADLLSFPATAQTQCDAVHGTKTPLHGQYAVCVLPWVAPSPPLTTSYVGIGLTGAGSAIIVAVVGLWLYRRRRRRHAAELAKGTDTPSGGHYTMDQSMSMLDLQTLVLCRLDDHDVTLGKTVATGASGTVSRGTFKDQPVAIKRLITASHANLRDVQTFIDEIKLLAAIDSPHVVKLVGCVWTQPRDMKAVLEWMDSGDLRDYLVSHRDLSWPHKVSYLEQIVAGLVYIHTMNVIHRDLKSRNIVLDAVKGAKLTDFGVAKIDLSETMTMGVGTFRWMAPEVLRGSDYGVAADMYSLGVVLSELDTHRIPYSDMKNENGRPIVDTAVIGLVLAGSLQPTFSSACPPWIRALAQQCLEFDPTKRPTAMQVMYRVHQETKGQASRRPAAHGCSRP